MTNTIQITDPRALAVDAARKVINARFKDPGTRQAHHARCTAAVAINAGATVEEACALSAPVQS